MADEDILNLPPAPDVGTVSESTLAPSASAEHSAAETDQPAETGEAAERGGSSITTAGNGKSRSPRPLPVSKRRSEERAARHGNYGMTPRRFVTLRETDPKPAPTASDPNKETREARAARGVRRALWIIAIATALNVGVAGLQWYELHRAYGPSRAVDAAGLVNQAALP